MLVCYGRPLPGGRLIVPVLTTFLIKAFSPLTFHRFS